MIDPATRWNGPFPYDVFEPVGITPSSSHAEVQDAAFAMQRKRLFSQEVQAAWDELRLVERRLAVDLLVYPEPRSAEEAT